jgi:hypothetical protein
MHQELTAGDCIMSYEVVFAETTQCIALEFRHYSLGDLPDTPQ